MNYFSYSESNQDKALMFKDISALFTDFDDRAESEGNYNEVFKINCLYLKMLSAYIKQGVVKPWNS